MYSSVLLSRGAKGDRKKACEQPMDAQVTTSHAVLSAGKKAPVEKLLLFTQKRDKTRRAYEREKKERGLREATAEILNTMSLSKRPEKKKRK